MIIEMEKNAEKILIIQCSFKLASRDFKTESDTIKVKETGTNGEKLIITAGNCSAESERQIIACIKATKRAGAKVLRGGIFHPRASLFSFQTLREEGLKLLAKARAKRGVLMATEFISSQIRSFNC